MHFWNLEVEALIKKSKQKNPNDTFGINLINLKKVKLETFNMKLDLKVKKLKIKYLSCVRSKRR